MRKLTISLFLIFIVSSWDAYAQDPQFTQYFASPLSLNPAYTGYLDGKYRLNTNLRQQWRSVGEPYNTASFSADVNLKAANYLSEDKLGVGLMAIRDESLEGVLKSNYIAASLSYHKSLAEDGRHILGLGVQLARNFKSIDLNKLTFGTQFTGSGFDRNIPVNFDGSEENISYFDLNIGLLYTSHRDWGNYYSGVSGYHLTRPSETIFADSDAPLRLRTTYHAGGTVHINDGLSLLVSGLHMKQGNMKDQMLGSAVSMQAGLKHKIYLGLWYRAKEAVIPYIGLDYGEYSFGFNYGIPTPSIIAYKPQSIELSLIFRKSPINRLRLCPRF